MASKYPCFRVDGSGNPTLGNTDVAKGIRRDDWKAPKSNQDIHSEAQERVKARGGDLSDPKDVLGLCISQRVCTCQVYYTVKEYH